MKTAGDLLKEKRLLKELDLEFVSKKTKIKSEYLQAIEDSDFGKLPSATFAKGFLRNYASFLHLSPETILAMFRRDFTQDQKGAIIPRGFIEPVSAKPTYFTPSLILAVLATLTFLGFIFIQLLDWWSLPKLKIIQPQNGETYGEKVTFKGIATSDATIKINDQQVILDQSGQFTLDLIFTSGTHSIVVEAKNRQGKSTLQERTFTVSK